ncbi:MAG: sigma-70 family RNA polymerase sigma factor [Dehalococcoidia bacterium]
MAARQPYDDDLGRTRGERDRERVERARDGDEEAWSALFEEHYPRLHRYFRSRVTPTSVAEDLAADTFVEAYRSIERFQWRERPFGAWLYGIARNRLLMHYRREGRRRDVQPPVEHARDEFLGIELRDALDRMPSEYRQALEYRYLIGLTGEEAAAAMGKSHGAYRALLMRATRAFRAEYGPPND